MKKDSIVAGVQFNLGNMRIGNWSIILPAVDTFDQHVTLLRFGGVLQLPENPSSLPRAYLKRLKASPYLQRVGYSIASIASAQNLSIIVMNSGFSLCNKCSEKVFVL